MKKFLQKTVIYLLGIIIFYSGNVSAFANFSDVSSHNKYFEAISYLQENNILNGYEDGTFKPFQTVNRAEFLKIVIEGSNLPTNINAKTPFSDIPDNTWYTGYVKKAFGEGWINGYGDGTFRPEQTITKVEALKILGKAQNWQIPTIVSTPLYQDTDNSSWYIGYVKYAKDHKYLEETGSTFQPLNQITRGQISEILFRTITYTADTNTDVTGNETIIEPSTDTSFDQINLTSQFPSTFFKNEIYLIEGKINNGNTNEEITAIVENIQTKDREFFSTTVTNNSFSLPVVFTNTGIYKIGLIPDSEVESNAIQVIVSGATIKPAEEESAPEKVSNISLSFADDTTKINFSNKNTNTLKKITFTQGSTTKTFISRQELTSIPLVYSSFVNFQEGAINAYIETAKISKNQVTPTSPFTKSDTITFKATEHTFDMISTSAISVNAPDSQKNLDTISISGTAKTDIQNKAYIIKADGLTETKTITTTGATGDYFGATTIKSGSNFNISYTPSTTGRYIIAIDNKGGEPIFSHPIYIGTSVPLIPDFFDNNRREFFSQNFNLQDSQNQLLNLINTARKKHGQSTVSISSELNNLAQLHADDMANNNYFAHVNLSSQTPDDRRVKLGISTPVGENIAKDVSIEFSHYSLMRSPSHRVNILKPDWERVGLGISEKDGYLYVVEEFSTNTLTEADFENFKTQLVNSINTERTNNSDSNLSYSIALENAANYLNDNIKNDSSNFTQQLFEESLDNNNIQGNSEVTNIIAGSWSDALNSIINEESSIFDSLWEMIGIDIDTDNEGLLHTIIILNK